MPLHSSSDGSRRIVPPRPDQLEVSLFGPGFGECVVLHIGCGKWIVVDSCLVPRTRAPAALDYFHSIGVNPADAVVMVVASHWHDDHVRGLSKIVEHCRDAEFVCSDALREREFLTLIAAHAKSRSLIGSGVDELTQILNTLQQSNGNLRKFRFTMADQCLLRMNLDSVSGSPDCTVYSLSPSSYSCVMGKVALGKLLPEAGPMRRVPSLTPNHAAVALWIRVGETAVLLGSDLEKTGHASAGWSAILSSTTRPEGKADIFKIAHHGSADGDVSEVWTALLERNPVAMLTPFARGRTALPTVSDVTRICNRTTRAYATGRPVSGRSPRRSSAVERTIREVAHSMRPVCTTAGHVRIRVDMSTPEVRAVDPEVETFNGALRLRAEARTECRE